jgi:PIN domain nuclease of toxin-antitoxin system
MKTVGVFEVLIAQAQVEAMILVTNDPVFGEYDVMRLMT